MVNLSFMFIKDLPLSLLKIQGKIFSVLYGILYQSYLEKPGNNDKCINKQDRRFTHQTITALKVMC